MLFRELNVDDIECDESIVVFSITKEVDSINFKNAIQFIKYIKDVEDRCNTLSNGEYEELQLSKEEVEIVNIL